MKRVVLVRLAIIAIAQALTYCILGDYAYFVALPSLVIAAWMSYLTGVDLVLYFAVKGTHDGDISASLEKIRAMARNDRGEKS